MRAVGPDSISARRACLSEASASSVLSLAWSPPAGSLSAAEAGEREINTKRDQGAV